METAIIETPGKQIDLLQQTFNTPRPWAHQEALVGDFLSSSKREYAASIAPGGGKTLCGLFAAAAVAQRCGVERIIAIVPSREVKRQWILAGPSCGINLCDHDKGGSNHFVATYAAVGRHAHEIAKLVDARKTLLILDEVHHLSDKKWWGIASRIAFANAWRILSLTGTPFRTDKSPITFFTYDGSGRCVLDFVYSYDDAVDDRVCRPVAFALWGATCRWLNERGEECCADFSDTLEAGELAARLNTALDPDGDAMRSMLTAANEKLTSLSPLSGGLAVAKDIAAANRIAKVLFEVSGEMPAIVHGRTSRVAKAIADFRAGSHRWLVAVRMISEGVDIPRLQVLAHATNYKTPLSFRQLVGRIHRQPQSGAGEQSGFCFAFADPRIIKLSQEFRTERVHAIGEEVDAVSTSLGPDHWRSKFTSIESIGWLDRIILTHSSRPWAEEELTTEAASVIYGSKERRDENNKAYKARHPERVKARMAKWVANRSPEMEARARQRISTSNQKEREKYDALRGARFHEIVIDRGFTLRELNQVLGIHYAARWAEGMPIIAKWKAQVLNVLDVSEEVLSQPIGSPFDHKTLSPLKMEWEKTIKALLEFSDKGCTLAEIAHNLNELGYKTSRHRPWTFGTVGKIRTALGEDRIWHGSPHRRNGFLAKKVRAS